MSKLKTYSEFVNEALIDAVKNPIKWKKIKNNAKKYQKAKVAQALNNVDYAKRKEKSKGERTKEQTEVLDQANKAKNTALKDETTLIGQRMGDLATTTGLKRVAQLAKTKSAMAANQIVLKAADGEEAKRLKIKQKALAQSAGEQKKALADYESTNKADPEETTTPTEETPATEETPDTKETPDTNEDKIAQLEGKIADQDKIQTTASEKISTLKDELKNAENNKNTGRSSQGEVDKIKGLIQQSTEDLTRSKTEEAALRKKLKPLADKIPESFEYVAESISDKFARLRSNL